MSLDDGLIYLKPQAVCVSFSKHGSHVSLELATESDRLLCSRELVYSTLGQCLKVRSRTQNYPKQSNPFSMEFNACCNQRGSDDLKATELGDAGQARLSSNTATKAGTLTAFSPLFCTCSNDSLMYSSDAAVGRRCSSWTAVIGGHRKARRYSVTLAEARRYCVLPSNSEAKWQSRNGHNQTFITSQEVQRFPFSTV